eukprot:3118475-Rhodomonas_salina.4
MRCAPSQAPSREGVSSRLFIVKHTVTDPPERAKGHTKGRGQNKGRGGRRTWAARSRAARAWVTAAEEKGWAVADGERKSCGLSAAVGSEESQLKSRRQDAVQREREVQALLGGLRGLLPLEILGVAHEARGHHVLAREAARTPDIERVRARAGPLKRGTEPSHRRKQQHKHNSARRTKPITALQCDAMRCDAMQSNASKNDTTKRSEERRRARTGWRGGRRVRQRRRSCSRGSRSGLRSTWSSRAPRASSR